MRHRRDGPPRISASAVSCAISPGDALICGGERDSIQRRFRGRHERDFGESTSLTTAGVDYHAPFGGRKASSLGPREQGRYAAEFYTTVKTAYTMA